ncbi:MAG: hypothetical protein JNL83_03770 [Myxococcales bacterium]|nr:hypothetical protein [Myxococcales bacterium]
MLTFTAGRPRARRERRAVRATATPVALVLAASLVPLLVIAVFAVATLIP